MIRGQRLGAQGWGWLIALLMAVALWTPAGALAEPLPPVTVYRSPTCGCCQRWVEHLQADGFAVEVVDTTAMDAIKAQYGVPDTMASCHTAIVHRYIVEGHVPAADIRRLLAEHPPVRGIAAPGMPMGSPGMESEDASDPYTVFSFTEMDNPLPFADHF
ncbi:MAG TPA: DUF411 domain-containing protein [Candidatus Obscuribacterales bacterium]